MAKTQAQKTAEALRKLHACKSAGEALTFLNKLKKSDPTTWAEVRKGR
jgi:hypothetical protein